MSGGAAYTVEYWPEGKSRLYRVGFPDLKRQPVCLAPEGVVIFDGPDGRFHVFGSKWWTGTLADGVGEGRPVPWGYRNHLFAKGERPFLAAMPQIQGPRRRAAFRSHHYGAVPRTTPREKPSCSHRA